MRFILWKLLWSLFAMWYKVFIFSRCIERKKEKRFLLFASWLSTLGLSLENTRNSMIVSLKNSKTKETKCHKSSHVVAEALINFTMRSDRKLSMITKITIKAIQAWGILILDQRKAEHRLKHINLKAREAKRKIEKIMLKIISPIPIKVWPEI